ncbi:hypothetical protein NDU88_008316 [Pleurodeles waltl]|uniref:Uncharacterized protein n=1 Tax=Pleurodeles waltl TaxID=8319 RepID=A0AAV7N4L2_PLEWA|nr:hypothetical protein NDU88_008316 [Pleurodeles waltl]
MKHRLIMLDLRNSVVIPTVRQETGLVRCIFEFCGYELPNSLKWALRYKRAIVYTPARKRALIAFVPLLFSRMKILCFFAGVEWGQAVLDKPRLVDAFYMAYYANEDEQYDELQEMPAEHQLEERLVEASGHHV